MAKDFSAIASISDAGEPVISEEQAFADMMEFMDTHKAGDILTDDEIGLVINALTAIGSDEVSVSDDGALQGNGKISYKKFGAGIAVKVDSELGCQGVWDRNRMEWLNDMKITKLTGDATVQCLNFTYRFISFGTGVSGASKVFYNYSYTKKVDDDRLIDFQNNGSIDTSQMDVSTNAQWGYCIIATCEIITNEGALYV